MRARSPACRSRTRPARSAEPGRGGLRAGALLACAFAGAGCGYTLGLDAHGAGTRTIAVAVAGNETFRQDKELLLTRAIYDALAVYSDLRPATADRADVLLRVEIQSIQGRNLVPGGVPSPVLEGALDYTVHGVLVERRSGSVLWDREFRHRGTFRVPVGETEENADHDAVSYLSRKIVLALEGDF